MLRNSLVGERLEASKKGLGSMELVSYQEEYLQVGHCKK
jgi:hypothetical protein